MTDKEIASQLRKPSGEIARKVGEEMYLKNRAMIDSAIAELDIKKETSILEIGFGNGAHVPGLFNLNPAIKYTGIDISEPMIHEATSNCESLVQSGNVRFFHTDGTIIPCGSALFDVVFSVNTIYFWDDPAAFLNEIRRTLKPGGQLVLGFGEKHFMKSMPFTSFGFNLFDKNDVADLVSQTGFGVVKIFEKSDETISAHGDEITRHFIILSCSRI